MVVWRDYLAYLVVCKFVNLCETGLPSGIVVVTVERPSHHMNLCPDSQVLLVWPQKNFTSLLDTEGYIQIFSR